MKKIYFKVFSILGLAAMSVIATSCLKDDRFVDFSKVGQVAEFPDALPGKAVALDLSSGTTTVVTIRVDVTGPNAPTSDVVLTLGANAAAIDTYNLDASHVPGTILPANAYSYPASVTIVAGKDTLNNPNRTANFQLTINNAQVPTTPGVNYVLPLGIVGAPEGITISGNLGAILYNFYHNPYDGLYSSVGDRWNYNAPADYPGNFPPTGFTGKTAWDPGLLTNGTTITTVNATQSLVHVGQVDGGLGYMKMTVDPATNLITLESIPSVTLVDDLLPALPGSAGVQSNYDPATKTINLYYGWTNTTTTGAFRVIHEKLVHQ